MKDFQKVAMLAGLILLVVVVTGMPDFLPHDFFRGLSGAFPWIVVGAVLYFVMGGRGGCRRSCRSSARTADEAHTH